MPEKKKKDPSAVRTPTKTKRSFYFPNDLLSAIREMVQSQALATTDTAVVMAAVREYLEKHGYLKKRKDAL
jgi:hypothetical protein